MTTLENKQALARCIELFNLGTFEWVDRCYSGKLEWSELPKASTPQGQKGDLALFRRSAEQLLRLFPDRKLRVLRSVAEDDCVVLEQEWQGTLAVPVGDLAAGRVVRIAVASFFTLADGLIVRQVDYCTPEKSADIR